MEALKNLYSRAFFEKFATILKEVYSRFDEHRFLSLIYDESWESEEFKQRMRHITVALTKTLPQSYADAIEIMSVAAPQCRGVEFLFFPDYIELNGMEHEEMSIKALEYFTRFSSAEFAIRPFIRRDPAGMMDQMLRWTHHESEHVRRLASEGCRPRLPWASGIPEFKTDPSLIIPVLTALKEDSSEYVRKSVANNLNDISKDHPDRVLDIAGSWLGHHPYTDWIVKHGCRTLLKQGMPEALSLFGLQETRGVRISSVDLNKTAVAVGEELVFTFALQNESDQPLKLRLEYEIWFVKANGELKPKRFKLSEKVYTAGNHTLSRKHSFHVITTRRYYTGTHRLSIIVNGKELASVPFELTE
ncbi:MAG: alkylation repair protein [Paenibacillus sp.]|jgi:3-methyladenine DNA glycosylase AlkC|nr:alkylation repair protein [Paenibacillus sp.]